MELVQSCNKPSIFHQRTAFACVQWFQHWIYRLVGSQYDNESNMLYIGHQSNLVTVNAGNVLSPSAIINLYVCSVFAIDQIGILAPSVVYIMDLKER